MPRLLLPESTARGVLPRPIRIAVPARDVDRVVNVERGSQAMPASGADAVLGGRVGADPAAAAARPGGGFRIGGRQILDLALIGAGAAVPGAAPIVGVVRQIIARAFPAQTAIAQPVVTPAPAPSLPEGFRGAPDPSGPAEADTAGRYELEVSRGVATEIGEGRARVDVETIAGRRSIEIELPFPEIGLGD